MKLTRSDPKVCEYCIALHYKDQQLHNGKK